MTDCRFVLKTLRGDDCPCHTQQSLVKYILNKTGSPGDAIQEMEEQFSDCHGKRNLTLSPISGPTCWRLVSYRGTKVAGLSDDRHLIASQSGIYRWSIRYLLQTFQRANKSTLPHNQHNMLTYNNIPKTQKTGRICEQMLTAGRHRLFSRITCHRFSYSILKQKSNRH